MKRSTAKVFDPDALGRELSRDCPETVFALLHGSARDGRIWPGSDVDIAVWQAGPVTLDQIARIQALLDHLVPGVRLDLGRLNGADPVYRFEALRGRLLFCRDRETYYRFFSLACREYESQMASYERQRRYRSAAGAKAGADAAAIREDG